MELKLVKDNSNKPQIGCRYKHFTIEEITYLYQHSKGIQNKINVVKRFINKNTDLEKFEKTLNINVLNNSSNEELPNWYIIKLIEYRRLKVDIDVLMKLRLKREDFLFKNTHIFNLDFIDAFEHKGIDELKYSESRIKKSITIALIKAILFYEGSLDLFLQEAQKYVSLMETNSSKLNKTNIKNAINIILEMGYDVNYEFNNISEVTITGELLINNNLEIRKALEIYAVYLKEIKSFKSLRTEISHLRNFFNFLFKKFPEVDDLSKLTNYHVREFKKEQKNIINIRNKKNSNATINHRLQALSSMINYLKKKKNYTISSNIVTEYDYLKESKKYPKYVSKKEIFRVVKSVSQADFGEEYEQHKLALIILIDTGRRIHEVLCLGLNCLKDSKVFFHKTKHNKPGHQVVGDATKNAIRKLKEYANNINKPLYSREDGKTIRRLFASNPNKGKSILSIDAVEKFFKKIQIKNNIVDNEDNPKYTLHDNKRNFVTNLLAAGVPADEVAKFLNQSIDSLLPYEINNEYAVKALKKVEEKGLLMGKSFHQNKKIEDNIIINILKKTDVVNRHKENLILKANNPKEVMPLALGYCTDNTNYDFCGDLICLACDEFRTDSIEDFRAYGIKMYKYIYEYKRTSRVKEIEEKLIISLEKVYENMYKDEKNSFKNELKSIKKTAREVLRKNE